MAFFSKVGGIMRQTVSKQLDSHFLSPSSPSIFQALRWMSSSKVFIGGLSYNTDDTSLREAFSQYGTVVDARVIVDRESSRSRGFGFVTYTSSEEASSAIQALDGQELHGRSVRVAYATERSRSPGFGGGGYGVGGGGYAGGGGAYGGGGGNYGGGDAGGYGGNYGGGSGTGGYGGGSGTGGYGGSGSGKQGGVDGYANSGGANYGGGSYGNGGNPGAYNAGGYGGASGGSYGNSAGSDATSYGGGANFDVSGGYVTSNTSFASIGFKEGSGLGGGSSDQAGITTATTGVEDGAGNFEPNEPLDRDERDDEEPDDFAKRV